MRTLRMAAITLLLATPAIAIAADALDPAREMVRLMAADESVAIGLQLAYRHLHRDGKMTVTQKSVCEKGLTPAMFTDMLAGIAAKQLSEEEIRVASQFFRTEAGKKIARLTLVDAFEKTGEPTTEKKPELSQAEHLAAYEFTQTSGGKKLLTEGVLTRSPDGRKTVMSRMLELQQSCLSKAAQSQ